MEKIWTAQYSMHRNQFDRPCACQRDLGGKFMSNGRVFFDQRQYHIGRICGQREDHSIETKFN